MLEQSPRDEPLPEPKPARFLGVIDWSEDVGKSSITISKSSTRLLGLDSGASRGRLAVAAIVGHPKFDAFVAAAICTNVICIILETDQNADCLLHEGRDGECAHRSTSFSWLTIADWSFLCFYALEAASRIYVLRSRFFQCRWNILDFLIVAIALFEVLVTRLLGAFFLAEIVLLRMFRIFRLARAIRILTVIPELYLMINGFMSAMKSMAWGFLLMSICLTIWSILGVELLHPINVKLEHSHASGEWCREAFSSVMTLNLLFFQVVVAGDSWGECAIPLLKAAPWFFPLFAGVLFSIQIGFMNLILAVIVERAAQAREEDHVQILKDKKKMALRAERNLYDICQAIDEDGSGDITPSELKTAYQHNKFFGKQLELMDIDREIMTDLFDCMHKDEKSGAVNYVDFIENIHKARTQDIRMLVITLKQQMLQQFRSMRDELIDVAHDSVKERSGSNELEVGKERRALLAPLEERCWIETSTAQVASPIRRA